MGLHFRTKFFSSTTEYRTPWSRGSFAEKYLPSLYRAGAAALGSGVASTLVKAGASAAGSMFRGGWSGVPYGGSSGPSAGGYRRSGYRKSSYKRRTYGSRKKRKFPSKAATIGNARPDVHVLDTTSGSSNLSPQSFAGNASFIVLNAPAVGAAFFNRIGRKIRMKSLFIEIGIGPSATAAADDNWRFLIVYDRQSDNLMPAITDVLADVSYAGTTTTTTFSHLNMANKDRFLILMDERRMLPAVGNSAGTPYYASGAPCNTAPDTYMFKRYIKLKGLETRYSVDAGTPAYSDITTGALWFFCFGNNKGNAAAVGYNYVFNARLKFVE